MIDLASLQRWRQHPECFIQEVLIDPQSKQPFVLLPAELAFLEYAFRSGSDGRLEFSEWTYGAPKKSGKTTFAAVLAITMLVLNLGEFPEIIVVANSRQQAEDQVFKQIARIIECSPLLAAEAKIGGDRIIIGDGTIAVISTDVASAAGSGANLVIVDELWAANKNGRDLFHELSPPPTRKRAARLVTSYAGFEDTLLHELYLAGLEQPLVDEDLYAGNGRLMFWSHETIAPWQTAEWIERMRRTLPASQFTRQIENRFVSGSAEAFVTLAEWDACTIQGSTPASSNKTFPLYVAVDASVKLDSTAIVGCTRVQHSNELVRVCFHKIFRPTPDQPLDFEASIERTIFDLANRFQLSAVRFDPHQMISTAQRLRRAGIPIQEFEQTPAHLTAATSNLLQLIRSQSLQVYPSNELRDAISRVTVAENSQGIRLAKTSRSDKIDVIVALAMASLAVVQDNDNKAKYYENYMPRAFLMAEDSNQRAVYSTLGFIRDLANLGFRFK